MKTLIIKTFLFSILSFSFLELKSQTNKAMTNDWVLFVNDFDFSESFKSELSKQLEEKLYTLNNLSKGTENPIKLVIGLEKLDQTVTNDYVFASANIFFKELDKTLPVSICWTSKDFSDLMMIQKSDLNNKKVTFEWCKDFPFEELKNASNTEKVYEDVNSLKYIIKPKYYPDLVIHFQIKHPLNQQETKAIENIFKKNKNVYVSDLTENTIILDFQIDSMNFKEEDYYKDIEYLKSSVKEISELSFSNKIENIEIK